MIEDAELLRRYAGEKSEEAFAALVQRHLGLVYACALRRVAGDRQLAEDVAQQVFTDVARQAAVLARRPVLAGWLFTSTRFAASKAMRAARRRLQREQEAHVMQELSAETTAQFDWDKVRPVLDDAIGELNEKDREAILLRFFEGLDFPTIGTKLGLGDSAARMRVERAIEKLRTRLERRGVTSTAVVLATVLSHQAVVAMPLGLAASVTGAALAGGALASGTVAGAGASAVITFLSMSKLQLGIASALAVAGMATFMVQADSNAKLGREIAGLHDQNRAIHSLQAENQRLRSTAAEVAALRQDDAVLAQLRDEAGVLQTRLQEMAQAAAKKAKNAPAAAKIPRPSGQHRLTQATSQALTRFKPLQDAKDWNGMHALIDSIIKEAAPESYDMAMALDLKAKVYATQEQYKKAIEPWEKALALSDTHFYFDEKQTLATAYFLAQLSFQEALNSKVSAAEQSEYMTAALRHMRRWMGDTPKAKVTPEATYLYASMLMAESNSNLDKVNEGGPKPWF